MLNPSEGHLFGSGIGVRGGGPNEGEQGFCETFAFRLRQTWFGYVAVAVFYLLDVYLTLLVLRSPRFGEMNPVNRQLIETAGPAAWVVFRATALMATSVALLAASSLAAIAIPYRHRTRTLDPIEEIALGAVTLFYAFVLVHNLTALGPIETPT